MQREQTFNPQVELALFFFRSLVACHFVAELFTKLTAWNEWVSAIADAGFPVPGFMLVLVVVLLAVGSTSILSGRWLHVGAAALVLYQVPTSIWFETSGYERFDSASALGGVLVAAQHDLLGLFNCTEQAIDGVTAIAEGSNGAEEGAGRVGVEGGAEERLLA